MWASGSRISTSPSATMSLAFTSPGLSTLTYSVLVGSACSLQRDLLQVEDDVGRVLDHAGDGRELVQHALDPDGGDGRALDRGEQHAPHRVPDGRAEARARTAGRGTGRTDQSTSRDRTPAAWAAGNLSTASTQSFLAPSAYVSVAASSAAPGGPRVRIQRARASRLLRVQLDDQLLLDGQVDLRARRQRHDAALELLGAAAAATRARRAP